MPSSIMNVSVANVTIQSWNSMELVCKYLVLQRASVGVKQGMVNQPHYRFPEIPRQNVPLGTQGSSLPVYPRPTAPRQMCRINRRAEVRRPVSHRDGAE